MKISIKNCRDTYFYLSTLRPFIDFKLPNVVNIEFKVNKSKTLIGSYENYPHTICVSSVLCETYKDVLETIAHEMIHLHLEIGGKENHCEHDEHFNLIAKQVCDVFGWDLSKF